MSTNDTLKETNSKLKNFKGNSYLKTYNSEKPDPIIQNNYNNT